MSSDDKKRPSRPVGRFRIGFLSLVQLVLVAVVFLALNFLSSQHHRPFDLSDDLGFTLSPSTVRYLQSDAIQQREDPVEMIVAFRADSPLFQLYDRLRPIAEEYDRLSGRKVRLSLIDPNRAPDAAQKLMADYGVVFNQDLVILDARSAEERQTTDAKEPSPHVYVVKVEDMTVFQVDQGGQRRPRGFLPEDALRAGLVRAVEGKPRPVWVLADKSDFSSEEQEGVWEVLKANLVSQNILPERVQFAGVEQIPEEVAALAIVAPVYDFSPEELRVLEEYWSRPRAALLVLTGAAEAPPRLRAFLTENGIRPRADRVVTKKGDTLQTAVIGRFTTGLEFMRDLWETSTVLEGRTRSLEVRESADSIATLGYSAFTVLEAHKDYWGETDFGAEQVGFNPDEDYAAPAVGKVPPGQPAPPPRGLALAAAVIRGNATHEATAAEISRMVVIANTDFLSPNNVRQANLDFLASATNWLVHRETLSGEGPRNLRLYKLPLLEPQVAMINRINLLFVPLAFALIGAMVWASRRA